MTDAQGRPLDPTESDRRFGQASRVCRPSVESWAKHERNAVTTERDHDRLIHLVAPLPKSNTQMRAPHVAELAADVLRNRILDGELADGDELPKQEDLLEEFGISRPSVREALRILEAEGLISVRRGKVGGAVVHRPQAENVAYTLGLVFRSKDVGVDHVSAALHLVEPLCASLCAARPDRATEVVPRLRAVHQEAAECIDDPARYTVVARQFHEELVACSGNEALIIMIGALESVWSGHATAWAAQHLKENQFPDREYRQRGFDDHEMLIRLIERGEAESAAREAARHLEWAPVYSIDQENKIVPGLIQQRTKR